MIVHLVLDPDIFADQSPSEEWALQSILSGVKSNGLILDTTSRYLLRKIEKAIERRKCGKLLGSQEAFIQLMSNQGKHYAAVADLPHCEVGGSTSAVLRKVAEDLIPDAVIATERTYSDLKSLGDLGRHNPVEVLRLAEYPGSKTEEKRARFEEWGKALDVLSLEEREDLLGRPLRYAKGITIFDYCIGSSKTGVPRFRAGIWEILRIWERQFWSSGQSERDQRQLEIFTTAKLLGRDAFRTSKEAYDYLRTELMEQTRDKFRIQVGLVIKRQADRIFHDRFLQAHGRVFNFGAGVDFLRPERDPGKDPGANPVRVVLDKGGGVHLRRYRELLTLCPKA